METSVQFLKFIWGAGLGSVIAFVFGEWSQLHNILVTMMVLDFITGLMKGAYNKKLDSKIGYKGLLRKAGIMVALIVANLADTALTDGVPVFVTVVASFYIAIEALSLLENLEALGLPLPKKLKDFFVQMRENNENGSN